MHVGFVLGMMLFDLIQCVDVVAGGPLDQTLANVHCRRIYAAMLREAIRVIFSSID